MFNDPWRPNITDYLAFIYSQGVLPASFPSAAGTVTGGDLNDLTDSTQAWTPNQWLGYVAEDITQGFRAPIASNSASNLVFTKALPAVPAAGDSYLIGTVWLFTTFRIALESVNPVLDVGGDALFQLAVYNFGLDRLMNYAQDVPNQTYFKDRRADYRIYNLNAGLPAEVSDQGSSTGLVNPEFMEKLTLQDLQMTKTPWGRRYIEIAQAFGPVVWGVT
jgi:hypothetical protein